MQNLRTQTQVIKEGRNTPIQLPTIERAKAEKRIEEKRREEGKNIKNIGYQASYYREIHTKKV